jgi:hypothetical protein
MIFKKLIMSAFLMLVLISSFTTSYAVDPIKIDNEGAPSSTPNVCNDKLFGNNDPTGACRGRGATNNGSLTSQVRAIVNAVNNFLIYLAPSIAVISIIVGAYMIIQNGFKAGVLIIQWALIGVVVVLLSSGILSFILAVFL